LEEVDLIVTRHTDLGWEVIINNCHKGLAFTSDIYHKIAIGDKLVGYIKNIRPDHKIDVSLQPLGYMGLEPMANAIYERLKAAGGYLRLHDKSSPEDIREVLQMSKKAYKKGIGTLYKERKIEIKDDGIYLLGKQ
jgi:predicted RNA-binding protein (virulence factor B family)